MYDYEAVKERSTNDARQQTKFPTSVIPTTKASGTRGRWIVLTWERRESRWYGWSRFVSRAAAVRYCDGKFCRGGSPVRVVRVKLDGRIGAVVDPFVGKNGTEVRPSQSAA